MQLPADEFDARGEISVAAQALSDKSIVERVRAGDVASFELLMRRYNQRLFRIARAIIGEDTEAEDIVQDAYVKAFGNLTQFEGRSTFSTWLTKIAVYEATARRRKSRRVSLASTDQSEIMANTKLEASEEVSRKELGNLLAKAVDSLPEELRAVFTMRVVEELSTKETADCLDLTPENVKVRLHRARLQLCTWIDRAIGAESRQLYMFDGQRCDRIVARVMERILG
jgi:RNA polymerase sigma-70 factor, ECF subfamily